MERLRLIAVAAALAATSACSSLPSGPSLSYEQLLQNTHENPAWARQAPPPAPASRQPQAPGQPSATSGAGTPRG